MFLDRGHNLCIGGVDIVVASAPSILLRIANPLYKKFFVADAVGGGSQRISLRIKNDQWPEYRHLEKIFDTQDSWSVHRDEKNYWLGLAPDREKNPLWVARFDRGARRVDLYCQAGPRQANGKRTMDLPLVYPLDQLLLMYYFSGRQGLLAHTAGLVLKGKAFLFCGASGAGKSTISELLVRAKVGKVLSDERMIVREIAGQMIAFGTPWAGTAGIARAGRAPLSGVFFLKHGKKNRIEKLDASTAADRLLPMASIPWYDPDTAAPIITFAKRIFAGVPAWEFSFTPDSSAIDFFREFIKKNPQ